MLSTIKIVSSILIVLATTVLGYRIPPRLSSSEITLGKQPRIINGINASEKEFPFMVSVEINYEGVDFSCSGVFISDKWVLTAGHCMYPSDRIARADELKVGYGSSQRSLQKLVDVSKVYVNPQYNPEEEIPFFDMALLELAEPVIFDNTSSKSIQISSQIFPPDTSTTTAGWGATSNDPTAGSVNNLQRVNLLIGSQELCQSILSSYTQGGNFVCTSTDPLGYDTCYGDSGSPLLYKESGDKYTILGILSYGDTPSKPETPLCGDPEGASFFSRPAFYLDFITETTGLDRDALIFRSAPVTTPVSTTSSALGSSSLASKSDATSLSTATDNQNTIAQRSCTPVTSLITVFVTVTKNNYNDCSNNCNYSNNLTAKPNMNNPLMNENAESVFQRDLNGEDIVIKTPENDDALVFTVSVIDIVTAIVTDIVTVEQSV
ncbi:hypothetical protein BB561_006191 [Smittium simulii]|uniref:Peptidase S1 domain-containing protein n=1 Tax=Smittium simulii TaxID=133385 RepID=A0A2T9Y603_9FUNG|nr:hypothetical protein BB561_006191 [Smittium simulii]